MLEEVGQTVLVGSFLDCTHVGSKIELCPLGRLVVVTDVISHSVVEFANLNGRIVGKSVLGASENRRHKHGSNENQNFSHIVFR